MANEEVAEAPVVEQDEAAQAEVEAREDAVLDELDPAEEPEVAAKPEPEPTAKEETKGEAEDSPDLADAYTVLRRDGFKPEDLEALPDETILRLAEHRKKSQGDVDRLVREAKESQTEGEDEQTPEDSEDGSQQAEAASDKPSEAYLQDAVKPFADYLGLDEEGSGLLAKSYEAVVAPLADQLREIQMTNLKRDVEQARAGLEEKYPQVADPESDEVDRVLRRMAKLYVPGETQSTEALMEEAITLEFRDELSKEAKSAQKTIKRYQRNGLPDSPKRQRKAKNAEMSQEEREDAILELLEGDDPHRLQRARELGGR
mgnify:CR=1 FL=1|jgi:hypothetical protein